MKQGESPGAAQAEPPLLQRLTMGHFYAQAVYVVAALGVADALQDGPKSAVDLARKLNAHAQSLRRVMRLLASAGLFEETTDGAFALTDASMPLCANVQNTQRARSLLVNSPTAFKAWSGLLHNVKTGETAFDHVFGMNGFEYFARHPDEAAIFNQAMSGGASMMAEHIVAAYDFTGFKTIMDVGGGHGVLLAAILKSAPHSRGILFDLPSVAEGARMHIREAGFAARCRIAGGDFFRDALPPGADAIVLKHVIHDWDEPRALAILQNCGKALSPRGKLLLVESVFPSRVDYSPESRAFTQGDLNMMVSTGGRQRTEEEFRALLVSAGFVLSRIVVTATQCASVVEAELQNLKGGRP